jgi:asparagine synthase (glutamine-hydrolysing)
MSAFVAWMTASGRPLDPLPLERLVDGLAWRGPDGAGVWVEGGIGLGQVRLRTTGDGAGATQGPIGRGPVRLAGDIRLDDREALIAQLGADAPAGADDDALVLCAYLRWGGGMLDRLAGDFAFVLWDARERRLLAARDPLGVAALYWAPLADGLAVSNSLACLAAHPGTSDALDEDWIADFLAVGRAGALDTTVLAGVRRLPPGFRLDARGEQVATQAYWRPPEGPPRPTPARAEARIEAFGELLERAVADRRRGARAGAELSGGMDSSSIAAILAGQSNRQGVQAFTYHFETLLPDDEGALAERIARHCGLPLTLIPIEPVLDLDVAPAAARAPPEPRWLPFRTPIGALSRLAAEHGRLLFSGLGGDPLFVRPRAPPPAFDWPRLPGALADARYIRARFPAAPQLAARDWLRPPPGPGRSAEPAPDRLLAADFAARTDIGQRRQRWRAQPSSGDRWSLPHDPIWRPALDDADPDFTGLLLRTRFPYFDLRLLRFLDTVPATPWLAHKLLLRAAMRQRLPPEVLARRKQGLRGHPRLIHLQRHGPRRWMRDLLALDALSPYVDRAAAESALAAPEALDRTTLFRLEQIWSLALWLRNRPGRRSASADRPALARSDA